MDIFLYFFAFAPNFDDEPFDDEPLDFIIKKQGIKPKFKPFANCDWSELAIRGLKIWIFLAKTYWC